MPVRVGCGSGSGRKTRAMCRTFGVEGGCHRVVVEWDLMRAGLARPGKEVVMCQLRYRRQAAVWLVVGLFVATGCGSGGSTRRASATTSSTAAVVVTTSTTADPVEAERTTVIDTYNASWDALSAIAAKPTGNPNDPALAATTADPLLTVLRRNLDGLRSSGLTEVGPFSPHPVILSLTPTTATIQDCQFDGTDQVNVSTGVHVPPIYPHKLFIATVTLTSVGWRVTDRVLKASSCDA